MEDICDIRKDRDAFFNKFDIHMDFDTNIFDFGHDGEHLIDDLKKYAPFGKDFEPPRIILSFKRRHGMIKPRWQGVYKQAKQNVFSMGKRI